MKLVGYTRVSTIDQRDNTSLDDQKTKIESYAIAMGHEIVASFKESVSGKRADNRPELQKAIAMLQSGEADGLIVAKLDRLGRNVRDILTLVDDVLKPCDKALILLDLAIDTSTPAGRMVLTMMAALAEMERSLIRERVERGSAVKHEAGICLRRSSVWAEGREQRIGDRRGRASCYRNHSAASSIGEVATSDR
jgi:site-specific DNA recombinase